jgi:hypothetical protein
LGRLAVCEKQIVAFLTHNNSNLSQSYAKDIATIHRKESPDESINLAIATPQMALETEFLQFEGVVQKEQNS